MHLIPTPRHVEEHSGAFTLTLHSRIVLGHVSPLMRTAAAQLQQEIETACGLQADIIPGAARSGDLLLAVDDPLPAQGYRLVITAEGVSVTGGDENGLMHGVQTLRQILRQCAFVLPALTIDDAPDYRERGFYHDITRGRTPTLACLKQLADEACFYKLNQLQLYIEHTYLFRDLSEMWLAGEPLTAEDILELDEYCAIRGIELVPSLSTFGHLLELLRTKSHGDLSEFENSTGMPSTMPNRMAHLTINVSDDRSLPLIKGMIDEFMPLFRSRRFNICADETFDLGKGRNSALLAGIGERSLYMRFVKPLCEHVVARGRIPMFWGDIVVQFADALHELPPETICLNWGYSPRVTEDSTRILHQCGATQYVCPGVIGWNQIINQLPDSYENIRRMAAYGRKFGAIGLLNTDWGDYGHINDPRFSLPGMIYGAQFAWSTAEPSLEALNEAIAHIAYGDRSGQVLRHVAAMQGCDVHTWRALVQYKDWQQGVYEEAPLADVPDARIAEINAVLADAIAGLRACAPSLDSAHRAMIRCWMIAAEGLQLWNLTGQAVRRGRKDAELAARLENWYRLYEGMWREVSRESELWRIRDMVRWYAREGLR